MVLVNRAGNRGKQSFMVRRDVVVQVKRKRKTIPVVNIPLGQERQRPRDVRPSQEPQLQPVTQRRRLSEDAKMTDDLADKAGADRFD